MAKAATAEEIEVKAFQYKASDADLAELKKRIQATRWPEKETVKIPEKDTLTTPSQGVPLATMQELAKYWEKDYDWRKCEARLNAYPQFMTEIDGLPIHFIHVKSKHEDAMPLIVTHGWPGSVVEQLKIIEPLTNPTAHGGTAEDAFHLVIPSIPGYGFSGKPSAAGWGPERIAKAWIELMRGLGYKEFFAQGGDWGAIITEYMAVQAPPELLGIHINLPCTVPAEIFKALAPGASAPSGLSPEESKAYEQLKFFYTKGIGYAYEMALRPQTLYGLADSPIALAAWMIDHDARSMELIVRSFAGKPEGLTKDDVLDNLTLTWLTNTGMSSGRLYWEFKGNFFEPRGIKIPVAVSAFPDEIYQSPKSWAEKAYAKLVYYNKPEKGGHFAAWEQPQSLIKDIRAGFKSLR